MHVLGPTIDELDRRVASIIAVTTTEQQDFARGLFVGLARIASDEAATLVGLSELERRQRRERPSAE